MTARRGEILSKIGRIWIGETSTFRAKAWPASLNELHDACARCSEGNNVAVWNSRYLVLISHTQEVWNAILSDREITDRLNQLN